MPEYDEVITKLTVIGDEAERKMRDFGDSLKESEKRQKNLTHAQQDNRAEMDKFVTSTGKVSKSQKGLADSLQKTSRELSSNGLRVYKLLDLYDRMGGKIEKMGKAGKALQNIDQNRLREYLRIQKAQERAAKSTLNRLWKDTDKTVDGLTKLWNNFSNTLEKNNISDLYGFRKINQQKIDFGKKIVAELDKIHIKSNKDAMERIQNQAKHENNVFDERLKNAKIYEQEKMKLLHTEALWENKMFNERRLKTHEQALYENRVFDERLKNMTDFEKEFRKTLEESDKLMAEVEASKQTNIDATRRKIQSVNVDIVKSYRDMLDVYEKETNERTKRGHPILAQMGQNLKGGLSDAFKKLTSFRTIFRFLVIPGLVLEGIGLLSSLIVSLGAAAVAGAAGLAPLLNNLGLLPGLLVAATQGMVFFGLAFGGIGKALGGDEEALARLGTNTKEFVDSINSLKPTYSDFRKSIQEKVFAGFAEEAQALTDKLLPDLNDAFGKMAESFNLATLNFTGWLQGAEGSAVFKAVLDSNANAFGTTMAGSVSWLQAVLRLSELTGPVINQLADDVANAGVEFENFLQNNGSAVTEFFQNGYDTLKATMNVLGDFFMGMRGLGKGASPLTEYLGDTISSLMETFNEWTNSAEGQNSLNDFFTNMIPNVESLGKMFWALAEAMIRISQNDDFKATIDMLTTRGIPAIEKLITAVMESQFLEAMLGIAEALATVATAFASLPGWLQTGLVVGLIGAKLTSGLFASTGLIGMIAAKLGVGGVAGTAAKGVAGKVAGGVAAAGGAGGVAAVAGSALAGLGVLAGVTYGLDKLSDKRSADSLAQYKATYKYGQYRSMSEELGMGKEDSKAVLQSTINTGIKTPDSDIGQRFQLLDQQMSNLGTSQLVSDFDRLSQEIYDAGGNAKTVSVLFPEVTRALQEVQNPTASTKRYLDELGLSIQDAGNKANNSIAPWRQLGYASRDAAIVAQGITPGLHGPLAGVDFQMQFAGGEQYSGRNYLVGEFGPEMWIDKVGNAGMFGLYGPELVKGKDNRAVIPASATSNPYSGNYGNSPTWAQNMVKSSVSNNSGNNYGHTISINVTGNGNGVDENAIKQAVMAGIREAEMNARERR